MSIAFPWLGLGRMVAGVVCLLVSDLAVDGPVCADAYGIRS